MESSTPASSVSVQENASNTCREFTLFPKLPPELKDMMWTFALPNPRVVTVHRDLVTPQGNIMPLEGRVCKANVNAIATGLLHICRRSRQIALRRYKPAFEGRLEHPIYFDWERDTVLVGMTTLHDFAGGWSLEYGTPPPSRDIEMMGAKIQHVAIKPVPVSYRAREAVVNKLSDFTNLSTVTWVWISLGPEGINELAFRAVQEMQVRAEVKATWKEFLQIEDESSLPQMEFLTEEEMKERIGN